MKCENCNHSIKRVYTWNKQVLGIECWKKIALPEIERIRAERFAQWERVQYLKNFALVEALKLKDLSKIKSDFKLRFIASIIEQFETKGFISPKQKEIINGTHDYSKGFYDAGMLNDKDRLNETIVIYNIGEETDKSWAIHHILTCYPQEKLRKYFCESVGLTELKDEFTRRIEYTLSA